MSDAPPGPWLRLTAVGAALATGLAAASGELGVAHRVLVVVALPPLVALVVAAWIAHRRLLAPAAVALVVFHAATLSWWSAGVHVGLAAVAFAAALVTAALTARNQVDAPPGFLGRRWRRRAGGHSMRTTGPQSTVAPATPGGGGAGLRTARAAAGQGSGGWRDYVTLTKPRIMSLLLLTGAAGMFVGADGVPPVADLAVMLVGLALACGGASALNHVLDRDIDRLMGKRTERRPVAAGRVAASNALEFGLALSAASFVVLASLANVLTAVLALVGNLFYVLVYTRWLKRATPQNIVVGGAAGAVPPLVGWAAATGNLTLPALALFAIVFVWTPPHFWALALLLRRQYEAAGIPMLPVVRGERETARQIVLYTAALVAVTLAPLGWGMFGIVYGAAAVALGAGFLALAWQLRRDLSPHRAAVLFHYSLGYLALLFVAMALDPVL